MKADTLLGDNSDWCPDWRVSVTNVPHIETPPRTRTIAGFWHCEIIRMLITVAPKNYTRKMSHAFGSTGKKMQETFCPKGFPNQPGKRDCKRTHDTCKLQQPQY